MNKKLDLIKKEYKEIVNEFMKQNIISKFYHELEELVAEEDRLCEANYIEGTELFNKLTKLILRHYTHIMKGFLNILTKEFNEIYEDKVVSDFYIKMLIKRYIKDHREEIEEEFIRIAKNRYFGNDG